MRSSAASLPSAVCATIAWRSGFSRPTRACTCIFCVVLSKLTAAPGSCALKFFGQREDPKASAWPATGVRPRNQHVLIWILRTQDLPLLLAIGICNFRQFCKTESNPCFCGASGLRRGHVPPSCGIRRNACQLAVFCLAFFFVWLFVWLCARLLACCGCLVVCLCVRLFGCLVLGWFSDDDVLWVRGGFSRNLL